MDIASILGLIVGVSALLPSMLAGGQGAGFLDPMSALLTLGGAVAATLLHFPMSQVKQALSSLPQVFRKEELTVADVGRILVEWSEIARRQGVLALEPEIERAPLPIMRHGLQRIAEGAMPENIRTHLELELELLEENGEKAKAVFDALAGYAPAFGMIGTIVGLIKMLLTMDDPKTLGAAMGLALITTFYGAVLANLVCLPIAGKLRNRTDAQLLLGQMVIIGLVAIASGESPSVVRDMMKVFCSEDAAEVEQKETGTLTEAGVV